MGVNLPAHLVVVKGTRRVRARLGGFFGLTGAD